MMAPSARTAAAPGTSASRTLRSCQRTTAMKAATPTTSRTSGPPLVRSVNGIR